MLAEFRHYPKITQEKMCNNEWARWDYRNILNNMLLHYLGIFADFSPTVIFKAINAVLQLW